MHVNTLPYACVHLNSPSDQLEGTGGEDISWATYHVVYRSQREPHARDHLDEGWGSN